MDGSNPKVSFIPKGSLVREESFLERRRPQSAIGFLSAFVFLASIGSYAGLYYYNDSLNKIVAEKTIEIKKAQKEFSDAPEVAEAKIFRTRADLAKALLDSHTVTSPVFAFLSKNTTESIFYSKFSFKGEASGATLDISGEAPNYAALAYQADVFRTKTKELSGFSVSNVSLTDFGTINFSFSMRFTPSYLLYVQSVSGAEGGAPQATEAATPPAPMVTTPVGVSVQDGLASSSATSSISPVNTQGGTPALLGSTSVSTTSVATPAKQSFLMTLWSKFKFW